jgi:predicted transcriptional regulator
MKRKTLDKDLILYVYNTNKEKGKYWVANYLGLNKSSVSAIINKYEANNEHINEELEQKLLELLVEFPYTGTKNKFIDILNISKHSLEQLLHKTTKKEITDFFSKPKHSSHNLTDKDIQDILDGSKLGIGNDKMGIMKNIDGVCIRNIRKKFLTPEEYNKYHSIERFYEGDYNSYYNDRGDKFLSTWEEKLADFLFEKNIQYHSNVRISYNGKKYSPDFYLPSSRVFIELFGMSNVDCYKDKMNEKIKFYNENKIKCLFLYEEDFMENKKLIDNFKNKVENFVSQIENCIFNKHIKHIYIRKTNSSIYEDYNYNHSN